MFSQRADSYDRNETIRKTREIPQQGQKGIPPKKARRRNPRANQINWADSAKAQGPDNGGRAEPAKTTRPQHRWRGKSHEGGLQNKGSARQKRELQYRYGAQEKRSAEASADLFKKIIHYASEVSHSTMQLFKNGLESGASALTIRNLASPSAVLQTSVRKRAPGRTGEVKRHLKRVIASG